MKANLAAIGIDVAIRSFDDPYSEVFKPGAGWDLVLAGWGLDWPDPSAVFDVLVSDVGFRPSWSPPAALSDPTSQLGTDGRKSAPSTEALRRVSAGREEPALT